MSKEIDKLKKYLEDRIDAEDRKVESSENFSLKIVSMLGDVSKRIIKLEERVRKLEKK